MHRRAHRWIQVPVYLVDAFICLYPWAFGRRWARDGDRATAGFLDAREHAAPRPRQERGAERCSFGRGYCGHIRLKQVRQNLSPQQAARTAAGGPDFCHRQSDAPDQFERISQPHGHTFHYRADEVRVLVTQGQADECAARVRISVGRSFADKVREEDQTFCPYWDGGSLVAHDVVRIAVAAEPRLIPYAVAQPPQGPPR